MNKAELVSSLETRLGSKRAASDAVEGVFDIIIREVAAGRKVGITGFGTFEKISRAARTGRNPRTGETVRIKRTSVPKFKPGAAFKSGVADPRSIPKTGNAGGRAAAGTAGTATKTAAAKKSTAKKSTAKATATKAAAKTTAAKTTATKAAAKTTTAAKKATPAKKTSTAKKSTTKRTAKR